MTPPQLKAPPIHARRRHDLEPAGGCQAWELSTPSTDAAGRQWSWLLAEILSSGVTLHRARTNGDSILHTVPGAGPAPGSTFGCDPDVAEAIGLHLAAIPDRDLDVPRRAWLCPICVDVVDIVGLTDPDAYGWATFALACGHPMVTG